MKLWADVQAAFNAGDYERWLALLTSNRPQPNDSPDIHATWLYLASGFKVMPNAMMRREEGTCGKR